jgi:tagatose-6-phosphate ketose/aldose isomerase
VVFLGSGPFRGLAREAALKVLELTNGRRAAIHDTPLGFRHGPKTFVDPETLVIVFLSADPHTRAYDLDLVRELRADGRARRVIALSAQPQRRLSPDDILITAPADAGDAELLFPYLAFAQLYAFHSSLALGLTPDNPNPDGLVNRVVQGVRIHPFRSER